jgi:hypothetical protein
MPLANNDKQEVYNFLKKKYKMTILLTLLLQLQAIRSKFKSTQEARTDEVWRAACRHSGMHPLKLYVIMNDLN